jgi:hypothetical protein
MTKGKYTPLLTEELITLSVDCPYRVEKLRIPPERAFLSPFARYPRRVGTVAREMQDTPGAPIRDTHRCNAWEVEVQVQKEGP